MNEVLPNESVPTTVSSPPSPPDANVKQSETIEVPEPKSPENDSEKLNESPNKAVSFEEQLSPRVRKLYKIRKYVDSVFIRLLFIVMSSYQIYFLACMYSQPVYFIFFSYYVILVLDEIWIVWKRAGSDYYWFSITFAAYTICMVLIIVFQMDYKYYQNDVNCETNRTLFRNIQSCVNTDLNTSICGTVEILIVTFMASLVVGRFLMPQSKRIISLNTIQNQIAVFTTLASDVIEISQYMQNQQVAESYGMLKGCQVIFAISLVQFSFTPAAVKKRNMSLVGWRRLVDLFFATEAWSFALALFTQEMPCFILRMILIFSVLSNTDYALYFFALKNGLMMMLLTFRIITIFWLHNQDEKKVKPSQ